MAEATDTTSATRGVRSRLPAIIVTLILTTTALLLHGRLMLLDDIENHLVDYRLRHGAVTAPNPDLVHVSVDKTSYAGDFPDVFIQQADGDDQYFMTLLRGEWPWSREIWAHVTGRLFQAGARGVMLDFIFPSEKPEDAELKTVLDRHADRVVIGALIDQGEGATTLIPPTPSLITPDQNGDTMNDSRVGLLNVHTDSDGVVRRGLYSLALNEFLGLPEGASAVGQAYATAVGRATAIIAPAADPPSGELLRFTGPPGTFKPISLKRIIDPVEWRTQFADPDFFRDKFVVIGPGSAVLNDYHRTPFTEHGAEMSGPELLLNQINAALQDGFIAESSPTVNRVIIGGAGLVFLLVSLTLRSPLVQFVMTTAISVVFLVIVFWLGNAQGFMLRAVFTPLAVLNGCAFVMVLLDRHRQTVPPEFTSAP